MLSNKVWHERVPAQVYPSVGDTLKAVQVIYEWLQWTTARTTGYTWLCKTNNTNAVVRQVIYTTEVWPIACWILCFIFNTWAQSFARVLVNRLMNQQFIAMENRAKFATWNLLPISPQVLPKCTRRYQEQCTLFENYKWSIVCKIVVLVCGFRRTDTQMMLAKL